MDDVNSAGSTGKRGAVDSDDLETQDDVTGADDLSVGSDYMDPNTVDISVTGVYLDLSDAAVDEADEDAEYDSSAALGDDDVTLADDLDDDDLDADVVAVVVTEVYSDGDGSSVGDTIVSSGNMVLIDEETGDVVAVIVDDDTDDIVASDMDDTSDDAYLIVLDGDDSDSAADLDSSNSFMAPADDTSDLSGVSASDFPSMSGASQRSAAPSSAIAEAAAGSDPASDLDSSNSYMAPADEEDTAISADDLDSTTTGNTGADDSVDTGGSAADLGSSNSFMAPADSEDITITADELESAATGNSGLSAAPDSDAGSDDTFSASPDLSSSDIGMGTVVDSELNMRQSDDANGDYEADQIDPAARFGVSDPSMWSNRGSGETF